MAWHLSIASVVVALALYPIFNFKGFKYNPDLLQLVTLPLMVLSLVSVMESLSGQVLEAADSLGSSPWRKFVEVIWPLTLPGVSAGSVLDFCFCPSAFITPAMLGGGRVSTVRTMIYEQFTFVLNGPLGAALVFVLLVMNFAALAVSP